MDGQSLNLTDERITQLKALFPDVMSEGRVDFDRLKAALGEHLANPRDRYELSWAGKSEARKEVQRQTSATLLPDRESSIDFDTSENLFIEGENLEALRVLQKSYFGKVKMIYIDPPYNTGNDSFVYPDDYSERKEEYERRTGIKDEAGYLNKQDLWKKNSRESGQFHSVWLSMMYPRLYLSRNLLREDGVIFISIDDNEIHNLRALCNEIFGEENFVAQIIWQKKYAVSNDDPGIAPMHDYILCFQKSDAFKRHLLPRTEKQLVRYKNAENDPRGPWSSAEYVSGKTKEERPTLWYPIVHPKTGEEVWPDEKAVWRYSKDKHETIVKEDRLYWGPDFSYEKPRLKRFLSEIQAGLVPSTWWPFTEVGHNDEGQKETAELIGKKIFSTPKPVRLLRRILEISTKEDDIVLDFFGGSGSTAQAVIELNLEDGGNRKFILVQLPEATGEGSEAYKAGYRTIADISKARVQKVIEKIKAQQATQLDFKDKAQDLGFKAYRVAPSNFKVWQQDVQGAEAVATQLSVFQNPYREGTNEENMLYELMLKSGLPLTATVEEKEAGGVKYYLVNGDRVFALHGVNPALIQAVEALKPLVFITLDKHFAKQDQLMSNTQLQLKEAGVEFRVI